MICRETEKELPRSRPRGDRLDRARDCLLLQKGGFEPPTSWSEPAETVCGKSRNRRLQGLKPDLFFSDIREG